eukprot:3420191-Pyramimonas_sp.AAC.1
MRRTCRVDCCPPPPSRGQPAPSRRLAGEQRVLDLHLSAAIYAAVRDRLGPTENRRMCSFSAPSWRSTRRPFGPPLRPPRGLSVFPGHV